MEASETSFYDRKVVNKIWGFEDWIENNSRYCIKRLVLRAGAKGSLHYHPIKNETFVCVEGVVAVEYGFPLRTTFLRSQSSDALTLPAGTPHRFWALSDYAVLIEASTHHDDNDVVRIEPSHLDEPAALAA